jgi:transcriptional regulator with GAF, ATPase, and Fis domain
MVALLTIEAGQGEPNVYKLQPGSVVKLGRHEDNQIVLSDEHVSRFHAEIFQKDGFWMIQDSGGRNGTCLDGETIFAPAVLANGARITLGRTVLRFSREPEAVGLGAPAVNSTYRQLQSVQTVKLEEEVFQHDELTALLQFMASHAGQNDAHVLIRNALEIIQRQTRATTVGFLSLEPESPLPRVILPENAFVDVQLSRQLTQSVQRQGKTVWLAAQPEADIESESLTTYADALCIPLQAGETPVGALHVYKSTVFFSEREVRFCEILARHLANNLHILRFHRSLEAENSRLRRHVAIADELVGSSSVMQQLRQRASLLAPYPSPLLIVGESGVGKELVAAAVHHLSPRREGPFVIVNCAALTADLADSELFGHRRGSFTGAESDHPGLFQQADEGTLFLDEIAELVPEIQAKLLRVVEGKRIRAVGATSDLQVDVRIIAATNKDLERAVETERFRQDLYFRLQGLQIAVPPLREHRQDISELTNYFLEKLRTEWGRRVKLSQAAVERLVEFSWPGNVRQLRFVLESAVALQQSDTIDANDLCLPPGPAGPPPASVPSLNLEELEAWAIRHALERTGNNLTQAARILGVVRDTLTNKMHRYGIAR